MENKQQYTLQNLANRPPKVRKPILRKILQSLPIAKADEILKWTFDIRNVLFTMLRIVPIIEEMLECGLIPCLVKLTLHLDQNYYPIFAADILVNLVSLEIQGGSLQTAYTYVKQMRKYGIYDAIQQVFERGNYSHKFAMCQLYQYIILLENEKVPFDDKMIDSLISFAQITAEELIEELKTERGEFQKELIRTGEADDIVYAYCHRHVEIGKENAIRNLSLIVVSTCHINEKRIWFIKKKGFIDFILKELITYPRPSYPSIMTQSLCAQILACLSRLPLLHSCGMKDDSITILSNSCDGKFVEKLVNAFEQFRKDVPETRITENIKNESQYHPEIPSSHGEFMDALKNHMDAEAYIAFTLANISEELPIQELFPNLEELIKKILFTRDEHDSILWELFDKDSVQLYEHGCRLPDSTFVLTFSAPSLLHSCGILFKNFTKKEKITEKEEAMLIRLADQVKNRGIGYFHAKDYQVAAWCFEHALRIIPEKEIQKRSLFHSNRAECLLALKKYEDAMKDAAMALKYQPDDKKASSRLQRAEKLLAESKNKK